MALLEMIHSGWMSQAIYVTARLGIAEALAQGPRTVAELAETVGGGVARSKDPCDGSHGIPLGWS